MAREFVIEKRQRVVVEENVDRIKKLFDVQIKIANGTAEKVWITLEDGQLDKAKSYIQALTNPEKENVMPFPASLIKILGPRTNEHFNLEYEYGVVIRFPQDAKAKISGSTMDVMLATSKLEALISQLSSSTSQAKKPPQPKDNRALKEFALKLGYEEEQINMVFEKFGYSIDQNTFLNKLITLTGPKTRIPDDRWSPVSPRSVGAGRPEQFGIVAKGIVPRSTVKSSPINSSQGYPVGSSVYGRELPVGLSMYNDSVGYIPRTTIQSTQSSNANASNVVARGIYHRGPTPPAQGSNVSQSNAIARNLIARTTSQTTQGSNSTYSSSDWHNGSYLGQGSEPQQVDKMVEQMTSRYQQLPQSDLRHIVIDGSNVAMSHGNNKVFSCRGIALCVQWFLRRGHHQITVFVPSWRKESAKMDNPIIDQHILNQLEEQGYLTFTPSRKVKGRRIVCYDDRYLIRLAERTEGIVVSNDNFKDLASENPKWRELIEQRLLMYSFVNDMFMPPDDPLGRHGPTLDEFLHKGTQPHRRACPYGKRCTYGARCKYHHPEREVDRLPLYQKLINLFPSQDTLILSVMKKYPQERDPDKLASHILNMIH